MGSESSSPAENGLAPAQAQARRVDRRIAKLKHHHLHSLHAIRHFLRTHSSYDVLPVSFRLVVFDTQLTIKSALDVMFQSGMFTLFVFLFRLTFRRGVCPVVAFNTG